MEELKALILSSDMDSDEQTHWLDIMPCLDNIQIDKLKTYLTTHGTVEVNIKDYETELDRLLSIGEIKESNYENLKEGFNIIKQLEG